MRTYTIADIRALNPCYDPRRYLPEDWAGTIGDGLRLDTVPASDRIWVATHLLDDRTNRLFAVWCARQALALVSDPDPRSVAACNVADRFANGAATIEELIAAADAAADAAWAAADAAADAAWAAADAAWAAADAAADAAWAAADAAWAAADAAWAAADAAWAAAADAAWATARDAARAADAADAQIQHLISMLEGS